MIKNIFFLVGFGLEKDGLNINNDLSWNLGLIWDLCVCFWYKDVKNAGKLVIIVFYVDFVSGEILVFVVMLVKDSVIG